MWKLKMGNYPVTSALSVLYLLLTLQQNSIAHGAGVGLGGMESWGFNGIRSGSVTMMSPTKLKIKGFDYTGEGPAVWFMLGKEEEPYNEEFAELKGTIIPDESGSCDRLQRYKNEDITLTLPAGMKFTDYSYLAVYCTRFNHNFGYVHLKMKNGDTPKFDLPAADTGSSKGEKPPEPCPQDHLDEEEDEEEDEEKEGEEEKEEEEEEEEEEDDLSNKAGKGKEKRKSSKKFLNTPSRRRFLKKLRSQTNSTIAP